MRLSVICLLAIWICSTINCCISRDLPEKQNIYTVYSCDYIHLTSPKSSGWARRLETQRRVAAAAQVQKL